MGLGGRHRYMSCTYEAEAQTEDGSTWKSDLVISETVAGHLGLKRFAVAGTFQSEDAAWGAAETLARRIIDRKVPGIEELWPQGRPRLLDS